VVSKIKNYYRCVNTKTKDKVAFLHQNVDVHTTIHSRMDFSQQYRIEGEAWNAMRSPFRTKRINPNIIEVVSSWHQYNVTLIHIQINEKFPYPVCRLIIDIIVGKDQRANLQIIDNVMYCIALLNIWNSIKIYFGIYHNNMW
jgi:hypothetical protein